MIKDLITILSKKGYKREELEENAKKAKNDISEFKKLANISEMQIIHGKNSKTVYVEENGRWEEVVPTKEIAQRIRESVNETKVSDFLRLFEDYRYIDRFFKNMWDYKLDGKIDWDTRSEIILKNPECSFDNDVLSFSDENGTTLVCNPYLANYIGLYGGKSVEGIDEDGNEVVSFNATIGFDNEAGKRVEYSFNFSYSLEI